MVRAGRLDDRGGALVDRGRYGPLRDGDCSAQLREDLGGDPLQPEVSATPRTLKMMCWAPASASPPKRSTIASVDSSSRSTLGQHRPLDLLVGAAEALAVLAQHRELGAHELGRAAEDVAGVGVLGHQPQRLSLPAAADQDRDARPADRLRRVDEVRRGDVRALEAPRRVPLPPDHISCAMRSVSSSHSKRSPSGGNAKPSPFDSCTFHAAPIPNQARPPESTSSVVVALIHSPGAR